MRKISVVLCAAVLMLAAAMPALARGGPEGGFPYVMTPLTQDQGMFVFMARQFSAEESKGKPAIGQPGSQRPLPIINIDIQGVDRKGNRFPFNPDQYKLKEIRQPYVVVILPAAFISAQTGGVPIDKLTQLLYYVPSKDGAGTWVKVGDTKGEGADISAWGKTADYLWFVVNAWPQDDRVIGCE